MPTLRKTLDWDGTGRLIAKVYADREWGEFVVRFFREGKHIAAADHHTIGDTPADKADAISTAMEELRRMASQEEDHG